MYHKACAENLKYCNWWSDAVNVKRLEIDDKNLENSLLIFYKSSGVDNLFLP
jgi:hypothetical protein